MLTTTQPLRASIPSWPLTVSWGESSHLDNDSTLLRAPSHYVSPLLANQCVLSLKLCEYVAGHIASLLVRFALAHKGELPYGWAPRILTQCGVPFPEVWDILHEMYESQVCAIVECERGIEVLCSAFACRSPHSTNRSTFRRSRLTSQSC